MSITPDLQKEAQSHFASIGKRIKLLLLGISLAITSCTATVKTPPSEGFRRTKAEIEKMLKETPDLLGFTSYQGEEAKFGEEDQIVRIIRERTGDPNKEKVIILDFKDRLEELQYDLQLAAQYVEQERTKQAAEIQAGKSQERSIPDFPGLMKNIEKRLGLLEKKYPGIMSKYLDQIILLKGEWEQIWTELAVSSALEKINWLFGILESGKKRSDYGKMLRTVYGELLETDEEWQAWIKNELNTYDKQMNKGRALRNYSKYLAQYNKIKSAIIEKYLK